MPLIAWFNYLEQTHQIPQSKAFQQPISRWITEQRKLCLSNNESLDYLFANEKLAKEAVDLICQGKSRYLNFYGPPKTIRMESYSSVRKGKAGNLRNSVVFVGQNFPERFDSFRTPTTSVRTGKMTGVEIMATHFANQLQNNFIVPISSIGLGLSMALFALMVSFLLNEFPVFPGIAATLLFCCSYLRLAVIAFGYSGLWLPVAVPFFVELPVILVLSLFWATVDHLKEIQKLKNVINQITRENDRLIDRFLERVKETAEPELKFHRDDNPSSIYAVCLATDVEGYTTLAETLDPSEIAAHLTVYYDILRPIINENGGVIRSIAGDGMIATWDDPAIINKRYVACKAALKIQQVLSQTGLSETLPTRFGLHEGEFFLLNIKEWKNNPIGDTINTVSRIEGVNKELKTSILASSMVTQNISKILSRSVGWFLLKGKTQPLELVELRFDNTIALFYYYFKRGLQAFQNGEWDKAEQIFSRLHQLKKDDGPSGYYLNKSRIFKENPPMHWKGYIALETK